MKNLNHWSLAQMKKRPKEISLTGMNKYEALIRHTNGNACWHPILESKVFVVPQETEELFLLHYHPKKETKLPSHCNSPSQNCCSSSCARKNRTELDLDSKALLLVAVTVKNGLGLVSPFWAYSFYLILQYTELQQHLLNSLSTPKPTLETTWFKVYSVDISIFC